MTSEIPTRRLSDKIRLAFEHALEFGRREFAEKLRLIHDSCLDEEADAPQQGRTTGRRR